MSNSPRRTGIDGIGDKPWGTHFCLFYETKDDLTDLLVPYFKAGIESHEFCLWIVGEPLTVEEARQALRSAVPDLDRRLADGQVEIVSHFPHLTDARFDPARVRQAWIARAEHALARGYAGTRLAGNPSWVERQDWGRFVHFEAGCDEFLGPSRIMAACAYSLARCSSADLLDVVRHHQFALARRHGAWEHLAGSELQRAHAEVRSANAELERRVGERTAQLAATNERLGKEIAERRRSEDQLRLILDTIPAMVFTAWPDGYVDYFNQGWQQYRGVSLESARGYSNWEATVHPDDRARSVDHWLTTIASGEPGEIELRVRRADGEYRWILGRFVAMRDESGRIIKWYGVSTDIDDRKRAEEGLRRSEELLRRAEAMAHIACWTLTVDDDVLLASDEGRRVFGWQPGPRRFADLMALVHPGDRPRVEAAMRAALAGTPFEMEHRIVVGGEVKWVLRRVEPEADAEGRVGRLTGVSQDVTARRSLEEQFRQAQKMEAVGTLAGGVAHDFNNILTIISGYCSLLLAGLAPGNPMWDPLAQIREAGERAAALTRQLLMFSRQQVVEPRVLDLNTVVADAERMLRRLIGEDVLLTTALAPEGAVVKADPGQLEQVLMNLAVNARDAMPGGGRLTIETANVTLDNDYAAAHPGTRPGEYVMLAVRDTGTGMDAPTLARVFEPFFTTKAPGKGTGLGLAVVHGVVTQSGGRIDVSSKVGRGTTFRIYLPAAKQRAPGGKSAPGLQSMPRGRETVLLAEDEDAVRALARHVLTSCGYTVLEAEDGREAVRVAEGHRGRIDLLVSDVVMPHLGGRQLAERLAAVQPGLKVLFLSGYAEDALLRHGVQEAEYAFLQKPFTPTGLAQKVREVLDKKP